MRNWKHIPILVITTLSLTVLLSACGGTPYVNTTASSSSNSTSGGSTTNPTPTATPTPSPTTTSASNSLPPITGSFTFDSSNAWKGTITVQTDNTLKVKVKSDTSGAVKIITSGYENWTLHYGCITFTVTVAGQSKTTQVLAGDSESGSYYCPGAASEQILDFSDRMTTGHGDVPVEIKVNTLNWRGAMESPYSTHRMFGSVAIQVNGTSI